MTRPLAQALVLDFGGVISKTLFETHDLTERALGLAPCTLKWLGPFAPDSDPLWAAMQRGEISERDYWLTRSREVGRMVGEDWRDMKTFVKRARGADPDTVIRPEAVRAIALAADAGFRLAILSNELDLFYGAEFRTRLSILKRFDIIVDATHTGILKPDPRAYQSVLDELALEAEDCVFVDDQRRNIVGAAACNMRTVLFDVRSPAASYSEALRHFGLQFD
ncbi:MULTISPECIES: HAD family hydrolase [unclassified Bradyrhizobium]|uniref:HAD family hydrolase n=1 Tax=unclassified Bradyrhizobium TaxID=2631580 RepID=UPI001BA8D484|nr:MULTISPECIES: HAD-IA family hydrolase [unclassified Bradyrhizobium]MBR1202623.1 HAD-IA family hydrolase [Bradyrhizobium sp. AUGA SZCCT0124]MBR1310808.1 HAD-IA family hydrolase [Bradyrhizobium sp. AUGA SZCCT0051]MBR1339572.1 HAD-IA family hydrolase [Bradyrhizobium sp. AUGA SZCCT0105]MBR1354146.1 HAD-IA family hydrolase [Bradyrhizobium sp. AUGA SZCCT0045]